MRTLFTGATGVIGRQAVPRLVEAGHDVTAVARSECDHAWLNEAGARPVAVDLFDPKSVSEAVAGSEAVLHFATAIPKQDEITKRESWATNDRLRSEATAYLVDAALEHGVEAFVQESITFTYADGGDRWLEEEAPIHPVWEILDSVLDAEVEVTRFSAAGGRGIVLRLSSLYGPGRASEEYVASVSARKIPIVGSGDQYISRLHVHDAGTAVAAALPAPAGAYNVSDDQPLTFRRDLETLAATIGAKPPRRVPRWLARMVAGEASNLLAISHRVSNERFRATTGWEPQYASAVEGWPSVAAAMATTSLR